MEFAAATFFSAAGECASAASVTAVAGAPNGMPSMTASTRMSRFWRLAAVEHPHLCKYFELVRCQTAQNAVILISEHYNRRYMDEWRNKNYFDEALAYRVAFELGAAVKCCHDNRITIGLIRLENLLLHSVNREWHMKLTQYGIYHLSGNDLDVDQLINSAWYLAPERLLLSSAGFSTCPSNQENHSDSVEDAINDVIPTASFKSDIWSFGIVLLEIFTRTRLADIWGVRQILSVLSSVVRKADGESALVPLLNAMRFALPSATSRAALPPALLNVIAGCLQVLPSRRPNAATLLGSLAALGISSTSSITSSSFCSISARSDLSNGGTKKLPLDENMEEICERLQNAKRNDVDFDPYYDRPLGERYFLWKLCGSGVESILVARGVIRMRPPLATMPRLVIDDFQFYGNEDARKLSASFELCVLPSKNLKERLRLLHGRDVSQSLEFDRALGARRGDARQANGDVQTQSLVVKERDIDYQAFRMRLFAKLLASHPYSYDILCAEARKDIPPHYRAAVWSALLGVDADEARDAFTRLDTFAEHPSDRQLNVDIPRCHQYDELMTSPAAHHKLKIMLKAWLMDTTNAGTGYVYWQGLDSLAAPFLVLNFNNVAVAFQCLRAFIERFLHNFFLQDNTEVIQDYLTLFMLLVEFIDPELASHLYALEFLPQLFAIPWFLTCFAHVLPFHKLFHLWDALLSADASFPLFIGMAILVQLRSRLIKAQFNDAILLFSDLPDLSIDRVVDDSQKFYNSVPASCTHEVEHKGARHCTRDLRALLVQLIASSSRVASSRVKTSTKRSSVTSRISETSNVA